jgi:RimJ/RimL family protein N-acetyltransferase
MSIPRLNFTVTDLQRTQVIRLITRSFASELVRYGMPRHELVSVSTELLDHAMAAPARVSPAPVAREAVRDEWEASGFLALDHISIRLVHSGDIDTLSDWLSTPSTRSAFYTPFPEDADELWALLLDDRSLFCAIESEGQLVGLIGGGRDARQPFRIEMRKLVGDPATRGKGIGKRATMLWLHLVFERFGLNKVFLYSLDTNIRNINLNSRFGFELEGILRDEHAVDGRFVDVLRMGLTAGRWLLQSADSVSAPVTD